MNLNPYFDIEAMGDSDNMSCNSRYDTWSGSTGVDVLARYNDVDDPIRK